jgi:hypothetical protein
MIKNAIATQNSLYPNGVHIMNDPRINCTVIAGYNTETMTKLNVDGKQIVATGLSMAGDGTVPLTSAIESNGKLFDNPIYLVNGIDHSGLFKDDDVIKLVVNLIDPNKGGNYSNSKITKAEPGQTAAEICARNEEMSDDVPDNRNTIAQGFYDVFIAYCPVKLSLYDAKGALVGSVSSAGVKAEDPADLGLFNLLVGGETKQVIVPEGYSVKVTGEEAGKMDILMATFNAAGEMMQSYLFPDMEVNPKMEVTLAAKDHEPSVTLDMNGDGKSEKTLTAEDGHKEVYIPMDTGNQAFMTRMWILIGISAGMAVLTAVALVLITLLNKPKKKAKAA